MRNLTSERHGELLSKMPLSWKRKLGRKCRRRFEETNWISPRKITGHARQTDQELAAKYLRSALIIIASHDRTRFVFSAPSEDLCVTGCTKDRLRCGRTSVSPLCNESANREQSQNRAIDDLGI